MSSGRTLLTIFVAVLLALVPAACGDDGDEATPGGGETSAQAPAGDDAGAPQREPAGDGQGRGDGNGSEQRGGGERDEGEGDEGEGDDSGTFVPKEHEDSGGGSEQFRVKGGDNSVQEFGSEADDAERDEAATALHNFLDARAAEDWEAACSFVAADVRGSLEQLADSARPGSELADMGCAAILEKLTNKAALPALRKEAEAADVGSLRVEGDRAFVIYRGLDETVLAVPMTKEGGEWKVAALAGTPLS